MLTWMRKKTKTIIITVAVVFGLSMFYGIGRMSLNRQNKEPNYLATISGKPINEKEYLTIFSNLQKMEKETPTLERIVALQYLALKETINKTLLLKEAKKRVKKTSDIEVDLAIEQIMQANKITSLDQFWQALLSQGYNKKKFKEDLKADIRLQKLTQAIINSVTLKDIDLKEIQLKMIRVDSAETAQKIEKELSQKTTFETLFKKYGGKDLGYITTDKLDPQIEAIAFALKKGEASKIIRTEKGYELVKVTDIRVRKNPNPKKDLQTAVLDLKKQEYYQKWIKNIRKKYEVKIYNHIMQAFEYQSEGELKKAIAEYKKLIQKNPLNPYPHFFLATLYQQEDQPDLALKEYQKAAELGQGDINLAYTLGRTYSQMNKRLEALTYLKKASLLAGDNLQFREALLKELQKLSAYPEIKKEKAEIKRIKKKEAFEKEMSEKIDNLTP